MRRSKGLAAEQPYESDARVTGGQRGRPRQGPNQPSKRPSWVTRCSALSQTRWSATAMRSVEAVCGEPNQTRRHSVEALPDEQEFSEMQPCGDGEAPSGRRWRLITDVSRIEHRRRDKGASARRACAMRSERCPGPQSIPWDTLFRTRHSATTKTHTASP